VVLVDGNIYGCSGNINGAAARSIKWVCQDILTGKARWSEGADRLAAGSVVCADGLLYLFTQDKGTCALVEASPDGWKEHGRFAIPRETKRRQFKNNIWAHPVVANGKLYLRDQELIFCYDIKDAGQ
jgi:outer membrane protein assembly factor BamB